MDNWKHRSDNMRCRACMYFVLKQSSGPMFLVKQDDFDIRPVNFLEEESEKFKTIGEKKRHIGRCRRHAPTMSGFPVVFASDWCGDHKLDEEKI